MTTALIIITAAYVALLLLRSYLALSYARTFPAGQTCTLPPDTLTIAQAILSGDPLLESRLAANLKTLPNQRFIWLLDEDDKEAQRISEKLQTAHLQIEICPPCPEATNPKLWKLNHAVPLLETPLLCVLDDDTTLSESSAAELMEAAASHTVATGLPCYLDSGDMPSGMLSQFVNNNSVFTYLGTSKLLPPFTLNGMGYAMRRTELSALGNFQPILHELTDDLALATLVLRQGGSIHQAMAPLRVQTDVRNLSHYMQLMHRWYVFTLLLLRKQRLPVQLFIFLLHGLPPLLLLGLVIVSAATASPLTVLLVFILRLLVITSIQRRFFGPGFHRPLLSILSELMQPFHLIHALACRTIRWRTRLYRVRDTHDFTAA